MFLACLLSGCSMLLCVWLHARDQLGQEWALRPFPGVNGCRYNAHLMCSDCWQSCLGRRSCRALPPVFGRLNLQACIALHSRLSPPPGQCLASLPCSSQSG